MLLATASAAFGQEVRVVDGDTLKVDGQPIRLIGIDAPESAQVCADGWPAGKLATELLAQLVKGRLVACEERGRDRYRRALAVCTADGMDVGAALVRAGMAWNFNRYSSTYVGEEAEARREGLGIHGHGCEPAWEWRRSHQP